MSSTGTISRVKMTPTTRLAEDARQIDQTTAGMTSIGDQVTQTVGIVSDVLVNNAHPERPYLIKAYNTDRGPLAGDRWIELNHSIQEVVQEWGSIRVNFKVRVTEIGIDGAGGANATVIGTDESTTSEKPIENSMAQGFAFSGKP